MLVVEKRARTILNLGGVFLCARSGRVGEDNPSLIWD